ncbi:MAG: hypothetical protein Q8O84_02350 [Nanoarchaeota archaeon]|nr:hypothetical protein [Nanoarchaeota archaeon]
MVKLMKVPKAIYRQVSGAGDVQNLMDYFFINTKKYVQIKLNVNDTHFYIKSADFAYSSEKVNSNNRITYVEFKEKYILAGVMETRTRFNNLQFTFFRDLSCLEESVL